MASYLTTRIQNTRFTSKYDRTGHLFIYLYILKLCSETSWISSIKSVKQTKEVYYQEFITVANPSLQQLLPINHSGPRSATSHRQVVSLSFFLMEAKSRNGHRLFFWLFLLLLLIYFFNWGILFWKIRHVCALQFWPFRSQRRDEKDESQRGRFPCLLPLTSNPVHHTGAGLLVATARCAVRVSGLPPHPPTTTNSHNNRWLPATLLPVLQPRSTQRLSAKACHPSISATAAYITASKDSVPFFSFVFCFFLSVHRWNRAHLVPVNDHCPKFDYSVTLEGCVWVPDWLWCL